MQGRTPLVRRPGTTLAAPAAPGCNRGTWRRQALTSISSSARYFGRAATWGKRRHWALQARACVALRARLRQAHRPYSCRVCRHAATWGGCGRWKLRHVCELHCRGLATGRGLICIVLFSGEVGVRGVLGKERGFCA